MYDDLIFEKKGPVTRINGLNRPKKHNVNFTDCRFTKQLQRGRSGSVKFDEETRVLVITGCG